MSEGRTLLFVLDSLGIGGAPDASDYDNDGVPDEGANTLLHIAQSCYHGHCDGRAEYEQAPRSGPLYLPNLTRLGLGHAAVIADGQMPPGLDFAVSPGSYAALQETSRGKDTPSGHYELCGVPVDFDWGYFPKTVPCFPSGLIDAFIDECQLPGILGNKHASGTDIIRELGAEHCQTGQPILYTSADSVLQIAAHEHTFGLDRLYEICQIARGLCDPLNIGRVIARPFTGDSADQFVRTGNRRDFAVPPPGFNLLDAFINDNRQVWAVGKIGDIFAHRSISHELKASGLPALVERTIEAMRQAAAGDLVFTNFVDFDSHYGHRRNIAGYASALEYWDRRLPEIIQAMGPNDRMLITADHGNDPSWTGTDHTREKVPLLAMGANVQECQGFTDVARIIAEGADLNWRPSTSARA